MQKSAPFQHSAVSCLFVVVSVFVYGIFLVYLQHKAHMHLIHILFVAFSNVQVFFAMLCHQNLTIHEALLTSRS